MISLALGVLAGCSGTVWWGAVPWWQWSPLLLPLVLPRLRVFYLLGVLLGVAVAGWTVMDRLDDPMPENIEESVGVEGKIVGLVADAGVVHRFDFEVVDASFCGRQGVCRLRVSWHDPPVVPAPGEAWHLPLRLHESRQSVFPGGFDAQRWQFREGLLATASVAGEQTAVRLHSEPARLSQWRQRLAASLDEVLENPDTAALVRGITVGDRSGFSPSQWETLNATGTTHLVAISGLHVGLVAGLIYWLGGYLFRLVPGPWPALQAAAVLALVGACTYAAMAGFAIPTRRALIMFSVLMLLLLLRRRTGVFEGLSVALVAVLLSDPLAVLDAGLFLSFGLVLALLVAVAGGDRPGALETFVRVQWVAGLAVLPLLVVAFQQAPLASPLANLLAVPAFMFGAVPAALAGTALVEPWPAIGVWLLKVSAQVLEALWPALEFLSQTIPEPPTAAVGAGLALTAMVSALAVVVPGPALMRLGLAMAALPLMVGTQIELFPRVDAYAINDSDRVFRILPQDREREFIVVRASTATARREIRGWLAARELEGEELVLVIDGPDRRWQSGARRLAEVAEEGQIYVPDAEDLAAQGARHCRRGVAAEDWRFTAPGPGFDAPDVCRIEIDLGGGQRLHSDGGRRLAFRLASGDERVRSLDLERPGHGAWEVRPDGVRQAPVERSRNWWQ